jgi:Flp pilus assembly pilin Flp
MVARWLAHFGCLRADSRGATAMEYGVIAAGIIFVVATAAIALGGNISALYISFGSKL